MKKKKIIVMTAVVVSVCSMSVPTYAAPVIEEVGNETVELCEEDGVFDDEEFDMDAFLKHFENTHYLGEVVEEETMTLPSLKMVSARTTSIEGTWRQGSDGRWWYQHTDGSYTTNGWEYIGNQWYYFDGSGWIPTGGIWYYCHETDGYWIDNTGTQLIQEALKYQGIPYVWGGHNLSTGVDCSGFVMEVTRIVQGKELPHHSGSQYTGATKIPYADLQPGDLIFYRSSDSSSINHVAFYVGKMGAEKDKIIHAAKNKMMVYVGLDGGIMVGCGSHWR